MKWPSLNLILSGLFLAYSASSIYSLSLLFVAPACEDGKPCLISYVSEKPRLHLHIYSSVRKHPSDREADFVHYVENFDYSRESSLPLTLNVPYKTRQNGTLFLHVILVPDHQKYGKSFIDLQRSPYATYTTIKMTQYLVPEVQSINLLGNKESEQGKSKKEILQPVTHIKSKVTFTIMTDEVQLPVHNVPVELLKQLRIVHGRTFLPIVNYNFFQSRQKNYVRLVPQNSTVNVTALYSPISLGKLRLMLRMETDMQNLKNLGFSDKDIDEVKGIFADTNIYLLAGTFFIATVHLLFDFLAFKNDVSFWRKKNNLVGLSKWTVIWCGFSQTVIFLYLLDEGSSMLVLIPAGVASIIEMWKLKKVLKLRYSENNNNLAEIKTRQFDAESMRYLSYLLYPLVIGGAIYSLLYQPHKSWYSWSINSLVNGVYAFGFLFMLPQLFVNYKLKSVAHLPWRTFMYKAFNTFIDDVFAFIITMPAAHRIACFRDDAVFLVYLYQRWLYPVDKTRTDTGTVTEESLDFGESNKKTD